MVVGSRWEFECTKRKSERIPLHASAAKASPQLSNCGSKAKKVCRN